MGSGFKELLIRGLREELEAAERISIEEIASKIRTIGFSCRMCGKCCRKDHGDNTVIVYPEEAGRICTHTGLEYLHVVSPLTDGSESIHGNSYPEANRNLIDTDGNIHTFGWKLCQKKNGDCIFIQERGSGNLCGIYEARPMLCSTYPFYMEDGELKTSECEGLSGHISWEGSLELAEKVLSRYIAETEETILLYERYEGFEAGDENHNKIPDNIREGLINYIVHDSKGSHRTELRKGRSSIDL
ncbi:MAG: YkgJ family cysteine cluster protein [Methanosarcinaceae archaeon]|nr:YkgJ family cysteine cluster protein [Methanosarcinaceae archaeon]